MNINYIFYLGSIVMGIALLILGYFIYPKKEADKKSENKVVITVGWIFFLGGFILLLEKLFI